MYFGVGMMEGGGGFALRTFRNIPVHIVIKIRKSKKQARNK
jgi:hypothetical protein